MNIYDGKNIESPAIARWLCGSRRRASIISTKNKLFIRIESYPNLNKAEFKLRAEERGKIFYDEIDDKLSLMFCLIFIRKCRDLI